MKQQLVLHLSIIRSDAGVVSLTLYEEGQPGWQPYLPVSPWDKRGWRKRRQRVEDAVQTALMACEEYQPF